MNGPGIRALLVGSMPFDHAEDSFRALGRSLDGDVLEPEQALDILGPCAGDAKER